MTTVKYLRYHREQFVSAVHRVQDFSAVISGKCMLTMTCSNSRSKQMSRDWCSVHVHVRIMHLLKSFLLALCNLFHVSDSLEPAVSATHF